MKRRFVTKAGVIILGAVIAGGVLWYFQHNTDSAPTFASDATPSTADIVSTATASDATAPLATSTPPTESAGAELRRYANKQFHFSLLFPAALHVTEYKEQGGALTVTFENPDADEQFQIYVTPYSSKQVSAERFKQDEPSGVRLQPTDIMVGGARATMFFSTNAIMGETREVWFIRGGYLYEVTTYKELDQWLGTIMQTWQFI